MKNQISDDDFSSREMRCHFDCRGKTAHSFKGFDGAPVPPIENLDLQPSERLKDDPTAGQPVWECTQCGGPRHGPDPRDDSPSESEAKTASNGERDLTNRDKFENSIFNKPQNHIEAITVKKLMEKFRQQGSYDENDVIVAVKSEADFPIEPEQIEQAIHNLTFDDGPEKPPTLLETEVMGMMRELNDGDEVETAALMAQIQQKWDVTTGDIENAIEGVMYRGECYENGNGTIIPV